MPFSPTRCYHFDFRVFSHGWFIWSDGGQEHEGLVGTYGKTKYDRTVLFPCGLPVHLQARPRQTGAMVGFHRHRQVQGREPHALVDGYLRWVLAAGHLSIHNEP